MQKKVSGSGVVADLNGDHLVRLNYGSFLGSNNQAELFGLIMALCLPLGLLPKCLPPAAHWGFVVPHSIELHKINWDLDIYCDSAYVVNGANDWVFGWANSGWKTSEGKPVANVEFWKLILRLLNKTKPRISWVKGHKGVYGNEIADELATDAMKKLKMAGTKVQGSYSMAIEEIWKVIA